MKAAHGAPPVPLSPGRVRLPVGLSGQLNKRHSLRSRAVRLWISLPDNFPKVRPTPAKSSGDHSLPGGFVCAANVQTILKDLKKSDWVVVPTYIAAALFLGIYSVRLAIAYPADHPAPAGEHCPKSGS
jgi:hypothetical protein